MADKVGVETAMIFTDGACIGNPGPGGYEALVRYQEIEEAIIGGEPLTTNNRMEMMAAIKGLEYFQEGAIVGPFQGR